MNDVLLTSDHPFRSFVQITRGEGYAQYGGFPVIIESNYHISEAEYRRRRAMPWPSLPGMLPPGSRTPRPNGENQRCARRRLECLEAAKLIEIHRVNAHPLLPVKSPLFAWQPGDAEPDCEKLAESCRERWNKPAVPMTVCVASSLAANLLGSTAYGVPHRDHRNHDLRLASVYAAYRRQKPQLAALWVGEHGLPKAGHCVKDPDAFLRREDGQLLRVIESAGRYNEPQVQSFHDHCEANELPYELWCCHVCKENETY